MSLAWVVYLGMVFAIGGGYVLTVLVGGVLELVRERKQRR